MIIILREIMYVNMLKNVLRNILFAVDIHFFIFCKQTLTQHDIPKKYCYALYLAKKILIYQEYQPRHYDSL